MNESPNNASQIETFEVVIFQVTNNVMVLYVQEKHTGVKPTEHYRNKKPENQRK